jgi:hypothetical protein
MWLSIHFHRSLETQLGKADSLKLGSLAIAFILSPCPTYFIIVFAFMISAVLWLRYQNMYLYLLY